MNEFTASNGVKIGLDSAGDYEFDGDESAYYIRKGGPNEAALAEFFRAKEDARLGRWRWPENPDITVRMAPQHAQRPGSKVGTVMIQQDSDGYVAYYDRARLPDITEQTGDIIRAGHAYFDAHPEPKPWHDARPGEVWALTIDGEESAFYPSKSLDRAFTPVAPNTGTTAVPMDWPTITAGRRIYPDVKS